jgi:hypothetical protein
VDNIGAKFSSNQIPNQGGLKLSEARTSKDKENMGQEQNTVGLIVDISHLVKWLEL